MDGREELVLVADGAVGDEDDLADFLLVVPVIVDQSGLQGGQHFRAAIGLQVRDEALGAREVLLVGRDGRGEQLVHGVVKRMTLNSSVGARRSRASRRPCFAWSMLWPDIEPELSITKIVSRSRRWLAVLITGGFTTASRYSSPLRSCRNRLAVGAEAGSGFHDRTKSRSAGTSPSFR